LDVHLALSDQRACGNYNAKYGSEYFLVYAGRVSVGSFQKQKERESLCK
jgi:hypothetical protein